MTHDRYSVSGSQEPPLVPGKWRVYSMQYCPYAHRARLVLSQKKVPHDIVNVNLVDKPEWLFEYTKEGKVPVLNARDQIVTESLDIMDFLDQKFPQPPLWPPDGKMKARDKELIEQFEKFNSAWVDLVTNKNHDINSYLGSILPALQPFEDELKARNTTFFGGNQPGMVDFVIWPWAAMVKCPGIMYKQKLNFPKDRFSKMMAWRAAMYENPAVKETTNGIDVQARYISSHLSGNRLYDDL